MSTELIRKVEMMPLPEPRIAIDIRPATMDDLPFIDALQDMHTKQVGFMPTKALEGKIKLGHILIAEGTRGQGDTETRGLGAGGSPCPPVSLSPCPPTRVGYLMGNDQYYKRDDLGVIYQMNVMPGKQRGLIGASLLKAQFERSAWGCKLYCCWCAQDLAANQFWEACGFVPLAFRTGARTKGKNGAPRMHIFWQKRIREGDTTTPWWFPSLTSGGAMMEDRLVFPIPSGVHWSDAMPVVLPGEIRDQKSEVRKIAGPRSKPNLTSDLRPLTSPQSVGLGFLSFQPPPPPKVEKAKQPKAPWVKQKNDPKYIVAARELRDRWLEKVNSGELLLASEGKYDVARCLEDRTAVNVEPLRLPNAA